MAKGNLSACLAVTLPYEGGYSDHPKDPGGATNRGITIGRLSEVRGTAVTKADVKTLGLPETKRIYDRYYWVPVSGENLPFGVDLAVFDFGVNSGPSRAVKYLQRIVKVAQDGRMGPTTLRAVQAANGKVVIQALCHDRLGFMHALAIWDTFKGGWSARVAGIEAKGVAMWLKAASFLPVKDALADEASKAKSVSSKQTTGAATVGGGGVATAGGGDQVLGGHVDWRLIAVLGAIAVAAIVVLLLKAKHNRDRAAAYAAEAAAV